MKIDGLRHMEWTFEIESELSSLSVAFALLKVGYYCIRMSGRIFRQIGWYRKLPFVPYIGANGFLFYNERSDRHVMNFKKVTLRFYGFQVY